MDGVAITNGRQMMAETCCEPDVGQGDHTGAGMWQVGSGSECDVERGQGLTHPEGGQAWCVSADRDWIICAPHLGRKGSATCAKVGVGFL